MTVIGVDVKYVLNATRYFDNIIQWTRTEIPKLTYSQAYKGGRYMISLMPKQTNKMVQALKVEPKGNDWKIVLRNPKGQGDPRGDVPYHLWYNMGKRGWYQNGKTQTGQFHFIEKTYEKIKGEYPENVEESLLKELRKRY